MIEKDKIYCMDCLEGMKEMNDNSVDITITSPPYNAGNNVRGNFYTMYEDNLSQDDYYLWITKIINECIRVSKYYVFFNFQILKDNKLAYLRIFNDFKDNIKDIIVWVKHPVAPSIQPTVLSSAFEFVVVFTKKDFAVNKSFERCFFNNREKGQYNLNVIKGHSSGIKTFNDDNGTNKAVFPQYFVKWFIDKFTDVGDVVLDPFMGCGTTAYVCKQNSRHFIGFEIEESQVKLTYEKLSQRNLSEVQNGETLHSFIG